MFKFHRFSVDRMSIIYSNIVTGQEDFEKGSANLNNVRKIDIIKKFQHLLCIDDGVLSNSFWANGYTGMIFIKLSRFN